MLEENCQNVYLLSKCVSIPIDHLVRDKPTGVSSKWLPKRKVSHSTIIKIMVSFLFSFSPFLLIFGS